MSPISPEASECAESPSIQALRTATERDRCERQSSSADCWPQQHSSIPACGQMPRRTHPIDRRHPVQAPPARLKTGGRHLTTRNASSISNAFRRDIPRHQPSSCLATALTPRQLSSRRRLNRPIRSPHPLLFQQLRQLRTPRQRLNHRPRQLSRRRHRKLRRQRRRLRRRILSRHQCWSHRRCRPSRRYRHHRVRSWPGSREHPTCSATRSPPTRC